MVIAAGSTTSRSRPNSGPWHRRELVAAAERRLEALGCPKVQLMVRRENRDVASLYAELGYEESDVLVLGKRLIADD